MKTYAQYRKYKKPNWAPPGWLFGPVWTVLYVLMALSFGYVGYLYWYDIISFSIVLPFILNLVFNLAFTPIQFKLRNFILASLDIVLVLATLVWAMAVIFPVAPWITYTNIPYLLWVSFATFLQLTITSMNQKNSHLAD